MQQSSTRWFLVSLCVAFLGGGVLRMSGAQPLEPQEIPELLQKLAPLSPPAAGRSLGQTSAAEAPRISMNRQGFVRSIGAPPGQHFPPEAGVVAQSPDIAARSFMRSQGRLFGVAGTNANYITKRNHSGNERNYVRLQQSYRDLPVVAAEVVVQINGLGGVESVLSDLATEAEMLDNNLAPVAPTLSAAEAAAQAKAAFPAESPAQIENTPPQLAIFAPSVLDEAGNPVLVWDLNVSCETLIDANARVLVDARSGQIVRVWTLVHSALNRLIYDANSTTNDPGTLVRPEGQPATGIGDADNAYTFLGDTYNFYLLTHGRDSLNGSGMALSATVRYCQPNGTNPPSCPPPGIAFFRNSNNRMYFGTGTVADDVTAHELTHGVTAFESGLIYTNTSGAINESFSDIWGEFVDLSNSGGTDGAGVRWDIGEDLPGGRIRSMSFPTNFNHPDSVFSPFYQPPSNTNDLGGVHRNSGVNNKLCYLLTDGGTFNGQTIYNNNLSAVAYLYYEVQANLLTSGAGWTELYNALTQAAVNLGWGITDRNNLYRACLAVEIATSPRDLYVDKTSGCPIPVGTPLCVFNVGPYLTVGQGVAGAIPGDVLHIRTGSYNEPMTIEKIVTLQTVNGPVTIGQ